MNTYDLAQRLLEYPRGTEVMLRADAGTQPLTADDLHVEDGQLVIEFTDTLHAAEMFSTARKKKARKKAAK